jgi:hypothetical protein
VRLINDKNVKVNRVKGQCLYLESGLDSLFCRANTISGPRAGIVLKDRRRHMQTASSLGRLEEIG